MDSQTLSEYNLFLKSHEQIQKVNSASNLLKQLKNINQKLIITTIQKIDKLLVNKNHNINNKVTIDKLKKSNILFVFDECHRSQAGDMHLRIRENFKNTKHIGFTGTPIFDEDDNNDKKELSTNQIFDECVHKYLIKNAIKDDSVLPFKIDYWDNEKNNSTKRFRYFIK